MRRQRQQKNIHSGLMTAGQYRAVLAAEPYRGRNRYDGIIIAYGWQLRSDRPGLIYCPHCGDLHSHGIPFNYHRLQHCYIDTVDDNGYFILAIGDVVPDVVERAAHTWHRIHKKFYTREKDPAYRQERFSIDKALRYAHHEHNQEVTS